MRHCWNCAPGGFFFSTKNSAGNSRGRGLFFARVKHGALSYRMCSARHMLPMWSVQCLVVMLSVKPIVNRFYYIPGQIRESCGCPSDIDTRRWWRSHIGGFANGRANEAIFVQKWHVSRGETTGRWKIRYEGNAAQTGGPSPHMYRVPQPLTNIFKPRANQVSDQVRQTRNRSFELSFSLPPSSPRNKSVSGNC